MDFLKDLEQDTTISSLDKLEILAAKIRQDPSVLWHFAFILRLIMRLGLSVTSLPDDLVLFLVCNQHEGLLSLIPKEERYRMITLTTCDNEEEKKTVTSLAAQYNFLSLLEHLAEPSQAFIQDILQYHCEASWIPLLQTLIHRNPSLMESVKDMMAHGSKSIQDGWLPYVEKLQKAAHPDFEPQETTRITFRLPTLYHTSLV